MSRRILLIAALGLSACSPEASNQQQAEAQNHFDQTAQKLEYIRKGARDEKIARNNFTPIEEYRQKQLDQVAQAIQPVTAGAGRASQQMAAQLLISETHASHARALASRAIRGWASEGPASTDLLNFASRLRLAAAAADQRAKVDHSEILADLNKTAEQLTQEQAQISESVAKLEQSIAQIQSQLQQLASEQKTKTNDSDDLARKAFVAKGQAQYDLYVKSAAASREADKITARSDIAHASLNLEQARLAAEKVRLEAVQHQIQQIREAAKSVQERTQAVHQLAEESRKDVAEVGQQLDALLKQVIETHKAQVTDLFAKAVTEHEAAIAQAEAAFRIAPADETGKPMANLAIATAQSELGFTYRQAAAAQAAYADVLKTASEALAQVQPDRAAAFTAASQDAEKRSAEAREQAKALLTKAAEKLDQVAATAKTARQPGLERPAVLALASANDSLAALTGDQNFTARAQEARTRAAGISVPD